MYFIVLFNGCQLLTLSIIYSLKTRIARAIKQMVNSLQLKEEVICFHEKGASVKVVFEPCGSFTTLKKKKTCPTN